MDRYTDSDEQSIPQRPQSGGSLGMVLIMLAIFFILLPVLIFPLISARLPTFNVDPVSGWIMIVFGMALLLGGGALTIFSRYYYRATSDMAFVRTGWGKAKVILDGGAVVIPLFHEITWVSLRTMTLLITRAEDKALLTMDNLRADITATFYITVPQDAESILQASRSIGQGGATNSAAVSRLIDGKLESALRQVSREMTMTDLMQKRAEFMQIVSSHIDATIKANGLKLEDVSISVLDQTRRTALRTDENIFDAKGARVIAQIITEENVTRNKIELQGKQEIKQRQVEADIFLAEQEVAAARVAAEQKTNIAIIQATKSRESSEQAATQARLAGVAEIERDQELQLARTRMEQALALAEQARTQATQEAAVQAQQAVEVATRNQQIAIAQAEQLRAEAVALQLAAEVKRTEQEQAVTTAEVTATAEREKQQQLIGAQAIVGRQQLEQEMKATVAAFAIVTQAEAELKAADNRAQALIKQAEAEQTSRQLSAKGELAVQSVPVEVDRAKVDVERERVAVQAASLESQAAHARISYDLQVALAEIEARKQALVAQYSAIGQALGAANMTIWGDPTTLSKMMGAFTNGQANGHMLRGLVETTPVEVKDIVTNLVDAMVAAAPQFFGRAITREQATAFVQSAMTPDRPNTFGNVALTNEE